MAHPTDVNSPAAEEASDGPLLANRKRADDDEMDITPMIDMTFLLLIFFLVCSTFDMQSPIELAPAKNGKGVGERESFVISVGAGGVDDAPVYLAEHAEGSALPQDPEEQRNLIQAAVESAKSAQRKEHVLIKADRRVAHRDVARVIKAVSRVEGMQIHLAVHEGE